MLTESQTPVNTLPCPNFVAGGNYVQINTSGSVFWPVHHPVYPLHLETSGLPEPACTSST